MIYNLYIKHKHFSLFELSILIVLIIVLVCLLLPIIKRTQFTARKTACSSNLKQCVNALLLYGSNNNHQLCTYGNNYSGWYAQTGIAETLGFRISPHGRAPVTERPVTICPDIWINSPSKNSSQAYGAAWFIPQPDYIGLDCEKIIEFKTNKGQVVFLNNLPNLSDYVLLADSAYTTSEKNNTLPGVQCILFARKKTGGTSHFPRAISLRHHDEANIGYADGHVGTTADRVDLLMRSKIGAYIDATGRRVTVTE